MPADVTGIGGIFFKARDPEGGIVRKLLGWVGAAVGGSVGWWGGARVGIMTAMFASAVATGVGLYLGWWAADRLLD